MCGIVGLASQDHSVDRELLRAMAACLRHRGPDGEGDWRSPDGCVGLAHRRLAIIDLSPAGSQPMSDAAGQLCIIFNGEIYNYLELRRELEAKGHFFRTASDTEVILEAYRAWGTDCLSRLNGMFAFGLFDSQARRLFLARDRAGEKPLFYRHTPGRLVFASELKALMADPTFPRRLDLESLDFYLAYGYVPGERCILQGVHKLGPAQALIYEPDSDHLAAWRYWDLPDPAPERSTSLNEWREELDGLLEDAVRLRLIADVPVGILLSGGLDSSLVTAMAARASVKPVKTFTISFPGHGALDEGPYARLVAEHFGTDHLEMAAEPASVALLPELARQYDEPLADHALVPTYLVSRLIRPQAKVALGGDGGDELFGGYPHYSFLLRHQRWRRAIPGAVRTLVGRGAGRFLPLGQRGRHHLMGFAQDVPWSIAHINLFFDQRSRQRLLAPVPRQGLRLDTRPESYKAGLCVPGQSILQQATRVDLATTLVDAYLVKVDRASMLNSLEIRAPFLDHRLMELAFGRLPDELRATSHARKMLLRHLARRLLPDGCDLTRKQGFTMPLANWFQGDWGEFMVEVLSQVDPHLFDQRLIDGLIAGQRRGLANVDRLFLLMMFELWRREYKVVIT